jgi:hypothetical protein
LPLANSRSPPDHRLTGFVLIDRLNSVCFFST